MMEKLQLDTKTIKVKIFNNTYKKLIVSFGDYGINIDENCSKYLNLDISNSPITITVIGINDSMPAEIRLKKEMNCFDFDLMHLRFGFNYSTYVKSELVVAPIKDFTLTIDDVCLVKEKILSVNSYKVNVANCDVISSDYAYCDKKHERITKAYVLLVLLLKYGILGILGVLFTAVYIPLCLECEDALEILVYTAIVIILDVSFVFFAYNLKKYSKLVKIKKHLQ